MNQIIFNDQLNDQKGTLFLENTIQLPKLNILTDGTHGITNRIEIRYNNTHGKLNSHKFK